MLIANDKDPLGSAFLDYQNDGAAPLITVQFDVAEDDTIDPAYFFRNYEQCPKLEQLALDECRGRVLDVGAGAGSHSLYLQQQGLDVSPIDISPLSVEVMKSRGLEQTQQVDFYDISKGGFDTLLLLMNGVGLVGQLDNFEHFFTHAKTLLNDGGQILLDSSDLIYLFEQEDGAFVIDLNEKYHGEVKFEISYKEIKCEPFDWLYVSQELLIDAAREHGFDCEILMEGPHYDYLARLSCMIKKPH
ncbi:MAG: methyltransferase [Cycloclasticus sp. symbiont of Poecilosclerida sp. M]|nr:MAG: methyltransferase [Cycloclasticus sp. symbiont of Poecilosclerida sp. M]